MTIVTTVFLDRSRLPTADYWADAIRRAGYAAELDRGFDPTTFSGFLPCAFEGMGPGFEYAFGDASEFLPEHEAAPAPFDAAASFTAHSSVRDLAAATIAASVLAALCEGVLLDCESGEWFEAASAKRWADTQLEMIASPPEARPREAAPPPTPSRSLPIAIGAGIVLLVAIAMWFARSESAPASDETLAPAVDATGTDATR